MKIILFVLLFISSQIDVYAQQKQSKKSWSSRETPVEVIKAKKTTRGQKLLMKKVWFLKLLKK